SWRAGIPAWEYAFAVRIVRRHHLLDTRGVPVVLERKHVQRQFHDTGCIQLQLVTDAAKNALHDMVAPDAASGNFVAAFFVFGFSWLQPCRIRFLGLNAVFIKNLTRAQWILVNLIQQHIAESDGFVSGCILASELLVGEVAG
ncbi:MAG: hypothetical protein UHH87_06585, partial [Akkermansia sp.]|nr:hypothetical protein [Akkermansia sp.]